MASMSPGRLFPARSMPRLGVAVKALRRERGLTQAELAAAAEVSRRWVSEVEGGLRESVELARLLRVLDVLDASLMIRDDKAGS